ncbi:GNAT family N-acetyltransferase [Novosphingobium sp. Chol11]|uniref:GNAT family N-acetyltransferase n=1 Tax=Novosphingobium sp. Chol11 TaxID=1385763 RepID=UPI0025DF14DA|nr:GNAT family N-acetyltransferase [Novosphingobium sp. Chol11]
MAAVYHAEINEALADPVLAALLGRSATSAPFDRLAWLSLLAQECLAPDRCILAVARDGDTVAVLPLRQHAAGLAPLANWYSFFVRPLCNDAARMPELLTPLVQSLAPAGALELAPMPEAEAMLMRAALREAGWIGEIVPCDTNHVLEVGSRSFAEYWAARPGQLRETVRRKGKKGVVRLRLETAFDPADWAAYEAIYALSWKPSEGNPAFLRRFAEAEAEASTLRLGVAEIDGRAVAAQFWTVEGGTAYIHKLAHDEAARQHSPGTLLSAMMFAHVIDQDRVALVDFGTGDDPYKRDWMESVRPRYRLEYYRPSAIRSWKGLAKLAARQIMRAERTPNLKQRPAA